MVLPERDVVLEERRMRTDNDPAAQLGEEMASSLFRNHPYGVPVIGWEQEIKGLGRQDALEFYRRFYTPNNAILVVAGDVTADEVRTLAERTYGKIAPRAEVAPRLRPAEPAPRASRLVTLADPRVAQPSIQRQYLVPSYARAAPREAEALDVLAHVLGAGQTSRLHRKLVVEQKLATSASAWYQGSAYDETRFGVWASPRPDVSLADLEAAIDAVLADLIETGISEDELVRAKTRLVADTVYAQDSQTALARIYGVALTTGSSIEDVRAWPDRVKGGHRGRGSGGRPQMARHAAGGDRPPGQGAAARGEALVTRLHAFGRRLGAPLAAALSLTLMSVTLMPLTAMTLALVSEADAETATRIERVVSPGGIEAWLVREPAVPLIALEFAVTGGSTQDAPGKAGTANLVSGLLDEGAGDLDSAAFQDRLDAKAIELRFSASRDHLSGSLKTLAENRDEAFGLLALAVNAPRFDAEPVERVRQQVLANIRRKSTNPNALASEAWWATAFPGHRLRPPGRGHGRDRRCDRAGGSCAPSSAGSWRAIR